MAVMKFMIYSDSLKNDAIKNTYLIEAININNKIQNLVRTIEVQ